MEYYINMIYSCSSHESLLSGRIRNTLYWVCIFSRYITFLPTIIYDRILKWIKYKLYYVLDCKYGHILYVFASAKIESILPSQRYNIWWCQLVGRKCDVSRENTLHYFILSIRHKFLFIHWFVLPIWTKMYLVTNFPPSLIFHKLAGKWRKALADSG